jgi:hypothetical protein
MGKTQPTRRAPTDPSQPTPMTTPPDNPTPSTGEDPAGGVPDPGSGSAVSSTPPAGTARPAVPAHTPPRLPSLRVTAVLAAGMLAIGVAVGAAIGPTPESSLAGERIPLLLPSIAALAVAGAGHTSATTVQAPPVTLQTTPSVTPAPADTGVGKSGRAKTQSAKSKTKSSGVLSPTATPNTSKTPTTTGGGTTKQTTLPPVTHVWLITLTGATFTQALAQPNAAPYIDSQLVHTGALLSGWSSLDGSALASEAGLLGGEPPQTLDSIVQPPCPEGAAGATCAPETASALTAADEFLKATIPSITSSVAYREHGLIVITFGSVGNASASGLPAGASTATLSSQPPVGVLLVSPFAHAGSRPTSTYDPTSPKQSLSELLH